MRKVNKVPIGTGNIKVNKTSEEDCLRIQLKKTKTMGDQGFVTKGVMYTERADGVIPEYDIRTDKWVIAENASRRASGAEISLRTSAQKKEETKETETV